MQREVFCFLRWSFNEHQQQQQDHYYYFDFQKWSNYDEIYSMLMLCNIPSLHAHYSIYLLYLYAREVAYNFYLQKNVVMNFFETQQPAQASTISSSSSRVCTQLLSWSHFRASAKTFFLLTICRMIPRSDKYPNINRFAVIFIFTSTHMQESISRATQKAAL